MDTYDENTIVKGIICKACKKELPAMTIKEHLDGKGCPCRSVNLQHTKLNLHKFPAPP